MGLYLEPQGHKLNWLEQHGQPAARGEFLPKSSGFMVVAGVDNGAFQAVALIFNKTEARRYAQGRPDAIWRKVPAETIKQLVGPETWKELD